MLLQLLPVLNVATWVATASIKGTVLIFAVMLFRRLLAPATASPWRHAVWLPVFACLICPFGLHLPLTPSFEQSPFANFAVSPEASETTATSSTLAPSIPPSDRPATQLGAQSGGTDSALSKSPVPSRAAAFRPLLPWLALMWAIGAAGLASLYLGNLLKFQRLRRAARSVEGRTERIFEECRKELRIHRAVRFLESAEAESPTIFGWWHPTLLLPLGLQERLDVMQLRYVLLHELAHVRRNDVLINWIAAIAQLLHWFNPIVWLATRLMRSDMEFASDASVLHRLSEAERGRYGDMLVQLADSHGAVPAPDALGVVSGHADLKGRLIMIARFGYASTRIKVATVVALAAFSLVALVQPGFTSPSGAKSGAAQGPALAGANAAATSPSSQETRKMGVPMMVLIEQIARNIHKRVIVDPRLVSSTVIFYGQSLDQITYSDFLTMLRVNGFTAIEVNNYINVIPDADVRYMPLPDMPKHGELPDDQWANMSIELKNACAYSLVPILRPLIPPNGDLVASSGDTIFAIDTYANLKRIRSIATELDGRANPGDRCGRKSASTPTIAKPVTPVPTAESETSAPQLRRVSVPHRGVAQPSVSGPNSQSALIPAQSPATRLADVTFTAREAQVSPDQGLVLREGQLVLPAAVRVQVSADTEWAAASPKRQTLQGHVRMSITSPTDWMGEISHGHYHIRFTGPAHGQASSRAMILETDRVVLNRQSGGNLVVRFDEVKLRPLSPPELLEDAGLDAQVAKDIATRKWLLPIASSAR